MSAPEERMDWDAALVACRTLRTNGGTVEEVLLFLRRAGFWKMDGIKALHALVGHLPPMYGFRPLDDESEQTCHSRSSLQYSSFRETTPA